MGSSQSIQCVYDAGQVFMTNMHEGKTTLHEQRPVSFSFKKIRNTFGTGITKKQQSLLEFLQKALEDTKRKQETKLPYLLSGFEVFLRVLEGNQITSSDTEINQAVKKYAHLYGCETFFD